MNALYEAGWRYELGPGGTRIWTAPTQERYVPPKQWQWLREADPRTVWKEPPKPTRALLAYQVEHTIDAVTQKTRTHVIFTAIPFDTPDCDINDLFPSQRWSCGRFYASQEPYFELLLRDTPILQNMSLDRLHQVKAFFQRLVREWTHGCVE